MEALGTEFQPIEQGCAAVSANTVKLQRLDFTDPAKRPQACVQLDAIVRLTNALVKTTLQRLQTASTAKTALGNNEVHGSGVQIARRNLIAMHQRKCKQQVLEYQAVVQTLKTLVSDQECTRLQLAAQASGHELTDAQAQSVVSRGLTEQVFQAVLLQDASSSAMQDIVAEVEDRHGQVLFLGQQVQEVYELMRDLALLIEAQDETLDAIGGHIETAIVHVDKGLSEVRKAAVHQRKSRSMMCCCLMILLVIVAVIVLTQVSL